MNNDWLEDEMTPWFNGLTPPTRGGLFKVRLIGTAGVTWGLYGEGRWRLGQDKYAVALHLPITNIEWRGLPETAAKKAEERLKSKRSMWSGRTPIDVTPYCRISFH